MPLTCLRLRLLRMDYAYVQGLKGGWQDTFCSSCSSRRL